jgi:LysM repeat protein
MALSDGSIGLIMKIHILLLVVLSGGFGGGRLIAQGPAPTTPIKPIPNVAPPTAPEVTTIKPGPVVPAPAPVVAAPVTPEGPKEYVIRPGDNPWVIAKKHNITVEELLAVNTVKDPKNLRIGDVLILPAGAVSKVAPAAPVAAAPLMDAPGPGDDWVLYTIKKGDNPWNVAKRMKLDHQKIISLNPGQNFGDLKIGQQIRIPKS